MAARARPVKPMPMSARKARRWMPRRGCWGAGDDCMAGTLIGRPVSVIHWQGARSPRAEFQAPQSSQQQDVFPADQNLPFDKGLLEFKTEGLEILVGGRGLGA